MNAATYNIDTVQEKDQSNIAKHAFALYQFGYNLIPINTRSVKGKSPCEAWLQYQHSRLLPTTLKRWAAGSFVGAKGPWTLPLDHLAWAVLTGAKPYSDAPGIICVDADDQAAVQMVKDLFEPSPLQSKTPKGGKHFIYRAPKAPVANRVGITYDKQEYKIDIRGDGGYFLCPGSVTPKGIYQPLGDWTVDLIYDCPVYDPSWMLPDSAFTDLGGQPGTIPQDHQHEQAVGGLTLAPAIRREQAKRYLDGCKGTQVGSGADGNVINLTAKLLFGFALSVDVALELLESWGSRDDQLDEYGNHLPWTSEQLVRKIEYVLKSPSRYPGSLGDRLSQPNEHIALTAAAEKLFDSVDWGFQSDPPAPAAEPSPTSSTPLAIDQPKQIKGGLISRKTPKKTARLYLANECSHEGIQTWRFAKGIIRWNGKHYEEVNPLGVNAKISDFLDHCSEMLTEGTGKNKTQTEVPFQTTPQVEADVVKEVVNICWDDRQDIPYFIAPKDRPKPRDVIPFANGLLDASTGRLTPHTPEWVCLYSLPYEYDPKATCERWRAALDKVFAGDQQVVEFLQEWFGYCLTSDTSIEKFLCLYGAPRSGKSTIAEMLGYLVGRQNVATPKLRQLGGQYGTASLLGKLVALVPDAHLDRDDNADVLETIKAITGNDGVTIERKYKEAIDNVRLTVRLVIATNELPKFWDKSAAIARRAIIIPFMQAVENPQSDFKQEIVKEISGVANWALAGLKRLRQRGEFKAPDVSTCENEVFTSAVSPILCFVNDCCKIDPNEAVAKHYLYEVYRAYCKDCGYLPVAQNRLLPELKSVSMTIGEGRTKREGKREYVYTGIGV